MYNVLYVYLSFHFVDRLLLFILIGFHRAIIIRNDMDYIIPSFKSTFKTKIVLCNLYGLTNNKTEVGKNKIKSIIRQHRYTQKHVGRVINSNPFPSIRLSFNSSSILLWFRLWIYTFRNATHGLCLYGKGGWCVTVYYITH